MRSSCVFKPAGQIRTGCSCGSKLVRSKIVSGKPAGQTTLEKTNGEMPNDKDVTKARCALKILFGFVLCGPAWFPARTKPAATETFRRERISCPQYLKCAVLVSVAPVDCVTGPGASSSRCKGIRAILPQHQISVDIILYACDPQ